MARIGILGGGQLGQMMIQSDQKQAHEFHVYSPEKPLSMAEYSWHQGSFDDVEALLEFGKKCDVVTYEFESLPLLPIKALAENVAVHPNVEALGISQDRLTQKQFLAANQIATAPFAEIKQEQTISTRNSIHDVVNDLGGPGILKTRTWGYDGKGQARISDATSIEQLSDDFCENSLIYEKFIHFDREVSIIAARDINGHIAYYPLTENHHRNGILRYSIAPAPETDESIQSQAKQIAETVLNQLKYVGVITFEFFQVADQLIVNEFACRVHNSGHWTITGATQSQFAQHITAITAQSIQKTELASPYSVMFNIIGQYPKKDLVENTATPQKTSLVHYQKLEKPNRKLGHLSVNFQDKSDINELLVRYQTIIDQS